MTKKKLRQHRIRRAHERAEQDNDTPFPRNTGGIGAIRVNGRVSPHITVNHGGDEPSSPALGLALSAALASRKG